MVYTTRHGRYFFKPEVYIFIPKPHVKDTSGNTVHAVLRDEVKPFFFQDHFAQQQTVAWVKYCITFWHWQTMLTSQRLEVVFFFISINVHNTGCFSKHVPTSQQN
jgi:hypothetical protein